VLLISLIAAIYMVYIEYDSKDSNPTLTALDTARYPIWNIDFPAVTLCGINRIQKSRIFTASEKWYVRINVYIDRISVNQLLANRDAINKFLSATEYLYLKRKLTISTLTYAGIKLDISTVSSTPVFRRLPLY
jgi:hypothetical protein